MTTNDDIILADELETEAYAALFEAAPPSMGLEVERIGRSTLLLAPRVPITLFNRVIGFGLEGEPEPGELEAILSAYRRRGVRAFWIHTGPATTRSAVEQVQRAGFVVPPRRTWAKVLRRAEPVPDVVSSLTFRELRLDERDSFAAVIGLAHEMPPPTHPWIAALVGRPSFRVYGGFDGDQLVAGGLTYFARRGAWLGLGGTLPSYRRRGGQGGLMAIRIRDALSDGAAAIASETGEPIAGEKNPSLDNMLRFGLVKVCSRTNWASPG